MMQMSKIDIAAIEAARRVEDASSKRASGKHHSHVAPNRPEQLSDGPFLRRRSNPPRVDMKCSFVSWGINRAGLTPFPFEPFSFRIRILPTPLRTQSLNSED